MFKSHPGREKLAFAIHINYPRSNEKKGTIGYHNIVMEGGGTSGKSPTDTKFEDGKDWKINDRN